MLIRKYVSLARRRFPVNEKMLAFASGRPVFVSRANDFNKLSPACSVPVPRWKKVSTVTENANEIPSTTELPLNGEPPFQNVYNRKHPLRVAKESRADTGVLSIVYQAVFNFSMETGRAGSSEKW